MSTDPDHALFVAILDTGSIAAAARVLGISPAMVSKRLVGSPGTELEFAL